MQCGLMSRPTGSGLEFLIGLQPGSIPCLALSWHSCLIPYLSKISSIVIPDAIEGGTDMQRTSGVGSS
jgi:hypothetical protein